MGRAGSSHQSCRVSRPNTSTQQRQRIQWDGRRRNRRMTWVQQRMQQRNVNQRRESSSNATTVDSITTSLLTSAACMLKPRHGNAQDTSSVRITQSMFVAVVCNAPCSYACCCVLQRPAQHNRNYCGRCCQPHGACKAPDTNTTPTTAPLPRGIIADDDDDDINLLPAPRHQPFVR